MKERADESKSRWKAGGMRGGLQALEARRKLGPSDFSIFASGVENRSLGGGGVAFFV